MPKLIEQNIVFFDGVCVLCNSAVDFLLSIDKKRKLKFSPLQGKTFQMLNLAPEMASQDLSTIVFWHHQKAFYKSKAFIMALLTVGGLWKLSEVFLIIPSFISDFFYDVIAKNRYGWFGKKDACRMPSLAEKTRFLE
jgi:predicted DCC family thiol-disulfide oxidoreductase YuxK